MPLAATQRPPIALLQLIVFLLRLFNPGWSAADQTVVANLPGYDGTLPFHLETGYEENGAELFYYFIQSEDDPRRAPLLLWLTGGDHCSVLSGLLDEIGPVRFIVEPYNGSLPRLQYNPYASRVHEWLLLPVSNPF